MRDLFQVLVTYSGGTSPYTVEGGTTLYIEVDASYRVDNDKENKGFIVTSDLPITVQTFSTVYAGARVPDAVLVRPPGNDFWISSF